MLIDKLLIPGWAGDLDSEELGFIKARLRADRRLRATWGFKRGTGRLSEDKIRQVALFGKADHQEPPPETLTGPVQLRLKMGRGAA